MLDTTAGKYSTSVPRKNMEVGRKLSFYCILCRVIINFSLIDSDTFINNWYPQIQLLHLNFIVRDSSPKVDIIFIVDRDDFIKQSIYIT